MDQQRVDLLPSPVQMNVIYGRLCWTPLCKIIIKKMFSLFSFLWQSVTDIEQRLQELRQMGHSQEDLDRIERIASQNRALNNTDDQSRKATATLMEIERNRQLILVQQGAQVLEFERKKVAELKRRVQDQVRAQWEERRSMEQQQQSVDREVNCHSLNSVGSSEESRSSLTGSDAPTERLIDTFVPSHSTALSFNRSYLFHRHVQR